MVLRIIVTFSSAILGNDSLKCISFLVQVLCPASARSLVLTWVWGYLFMVLPWSFVLDLFAHFGQLVSEHLPQVLA